MLFRSIILSRSRKHQSLANFCEGSAFAIPENANSSIVKLAEEGYVSSYLVNSCGLSEADANSASKKVHFDDIDKPNTVLNFFEKQGFSKTEIAELVRKKPKLLLANHEKSLLPKIEFFLQLAGFPKEDALTTLSKHPHFLSFSVKHRLAPVFNYAKDVIGTVKAQALLRHGSWAFNIDPNDRLIPNVEYLRELGVPINCIELALFHCGNIFSQEPIKFREVVEEVKQMGIDPTKTMFIMAIEARSGKGTLELWDKCYQVYSKWGWSKDDIYMAFRKHPHCMLLSEKKISETLDFLVNMLGRDPCSVAHFPTIIMYNLEKRIIPRCSVVHLLSLKGLVKKDWSLTSVLAPAERVFMERYVTKYTKQVPQIYDIYQGKKLESVVGQNAVAASAKVHLDGPEKANAVLKFLEKRGFSKTQIAELVTRHPQVLVSNPDKSLLPKIEFFLHFTGISEKDAFTAMARYPSLLTRNLKQRLEPVYEYLADIIGTVKAQALLKSRSWIFSLDPTERVIPNVDFLKKLGVPQQCIELAVFQCPGFFCAKHDEFKQVVEEVKEMGFDVTKSMFILAIHARKGKGNLNLWDKCYKVYSKWGWLKDDMHMASRKHPYCILLTEKKISTALDFLVNKVGVDSRSVALRPYVLFYSMEKRIIPRCSIILFLSSKGLVKKNWNLSSILGCTEKKFVERYVTCYAEEVPKIYDIYREKQGLSNRESVEEEEEED